MQQKLKKLVIFVVICGLVAFVANLLIDNPYTHRLIRLAINDKVTAKTNLMVDFKAIKATLVPPGVDLYGLYVAPKAASESPLLTVSQLRAKVSVWALILGEFRLSRLELNDLSLVWPPPWNFPGFLKTPAATSAPEAPSWPPDVDLPVDRIVLTNAQAYLEVPTFQIPQKAGFAAVSLVGLDGSLSYHGWQNLRLEASIKSLDASVGASSLLEDTKVELSAEVVGKHITFSEVKTKGERLNVDGSGSLDLVPAATGSQLKEATLALHSKIAADFSLLGSFLDLGDTFGPVTGSADISATIPFVKDEPGRFEVQGDGQAQDAYLAGFRLFNSKARFAIDDSSVKLPQIDVIVGDKTVGQASGVINIDQAVSFQFQGKPRGLHLVDLLDALTIPNQLVDLTLTSNDLSIKGQGIPLAIEVASNVRVDDVQVPLLGPSAPQYPRSPVCDAYLQVHVSSSQIGFDGTRGTCAKADGTAASPFDFGGAIRFAAPGGLDLQLHAAALDLSLVEYFARLPMAGQSVVDTRIHGSLQTFLIDTKVAAQDVAVMHVPLGRVAGRATVDGTDISWQGVEVRPDEGGLITAPSGRLQAGSYGLPLTLSLQVQDLPQDAVAAALAGLGVADGTGVAISHADATFTGPLLQPLAGHGEVKFKLEDGTYDQQTLFNAATGTITADAHGWAAEDAVVSLGTLNMGIKCRHTRSTGKPSAGAASIWQTLGLHDTDAFTCSLASKPPLPVLAGGDQPPPGDDHLGLLPYAGSILRDGAISGLLEAQGEFSGTFSDVQGTFTTGILQPTVMGSKVAKVNVRGFLRNSHLDLVIDHGGNALEGRLSMDLLAAGVPFEWYFTANRLDLRLLGTEFFSADPRNYAYLTGDWRLKGQFTDWWHAVGELNIKDVRANYVHDIGTQTKTLAVRQDQPAKLLFRPDGWHFAGDKELFLSGSGVQFSLKTEQSRPPERLGFKAVSIIDMALAKEFMQEVETAEGKIRIAFEVFGSVSEPRPTVDITDVKQGPLTAATWQPLSLGIADIRPAFRAIDMHLIYRGGRLIIDRLAADKGLGRIAASGNLNLSSSSPEESHVEVNLKDATVVFPVAFLKSFETQMSGSMALSGKGLPYKLAGDIVINRARSTREVDIRDEIINALRRKSIATTAVNDKPMLLLDLNIAARKSINIHNRNLQAQLSTDLHIKGSDIAPVVSGQVEINKGKFTYKQEFKITRGLVSFDDPVKPDPSLDILAVSEVSTYRVYITVNGRASNPSVEFSIDPPTRESGTPINKLDILVLLSSGKLPEETRAQGQDTQNAATSEAANLILGQFEEPVEKLLESSGQSVVRDVYFDTHPAPDGSPVPRINMPVDLGENIDFVLRTDQATSEVSLEYNINESIAISGLREIQHSKDQHPTQPTPGEIEGDSKVNLKFRFSFE